MGITEQAYHTMRLTRVRCAISAFRLIAWSPYPAEADSITVPNPKDLVTAGLNNIMDTRIKIAATWADMVVGYWNGSYIDVAQVLSVPVFMLEQAVDAMAQVKDIGK